MTIRINKLAFLKFAIHQLTRLLAVGWMFMVFVLFLSAFINPEKVAYISINSWGEANFEMILLSLGIPLIIAFLVGDVFNDIRELKQAQALKRFLPTIDT